MRNFFFSCVCECALAKVWREGLSSLVEPHILHKFHDLFSIGVTPSVEFDSAPKCTSISPPFVVRNSKLLLERDFSPDSQWCMDSITLSISVLMWRTTSPTTLLDGLNHGRDSFDIDDGASHSFIRSFICPFVNNLLIALRVPFFPMIIQRPIFQF